MILLVVVRARGPLATAFAAEHSVNHEDITTSADLAARAMSARDLSVRQVRQGRLDAPFAAAAPVGRAALQGQHAVLLLLLVRMIVVVEIWEGSVKDVMSHVIVVEVREAAVNLRK